ncbi:Cof-type HAD-IIB family hydrolase [Gottschalkiaceae bacterium SANA]|nr:Cof-type HAD-IIB family hydrolase [Gottschalkiaceae bacterium SANA]
MVKKMIVSDLDGTLLRSDKTVSAHSIEVLRSMAEKGIQLVFATARPPRDAFRLIPDALKNEYVICYNGAIIYRDAEVIFNQEISRHMVIEIIELAEKQGLNNICMEVNDKLYANFDIVDVFGQIPYELVDLKTFKFKEAFKVMIYADERITIEFTSHLPQGCRGVVTDDGTLCQIMHAEVTKWNSIVRVLDRFEMSHSDVITFGDDFNDMEMILHAGVGVAMGNAVDELKALADHVTVTNDQDGVAVFLRDLCL